MDEERECPSTKFRLAWRSSSGMEGMGWKMDMERWNWIGYTGTVPTNTSRPGSGSGSVWAKELALACSVHTRTLVWIWLWVMGYGDMDG